MGTWQGWCPGGLSTTAPTSLQYEAPLVLQLLHHVGRGVHGSHAGPDAAQAHARAHRPEQGTLVHGHMARSAERLHIAARRGCGVVALRRFV